MLRIIIAFVLMIVACAPAHSAIHILKDKEKKEPVKNAKLEGNWQIQNANAPTESRGIIPVPSSADSKNINTRPKPTQVVAMSNKPRPTPQQADVPNAQATLDKQAVAQNFPVPEFEESSEVAPPPTLEEEMVSILEEREHYKRLAGTLQNRINTLAPESEFATTEAEKGEFVVMGKQPKTDYTKAIAREKLIEKRASLDVLNLSLKDDSRSVQTERDTKAKELCKTFTYKSGLLKRNLVQMLDQCGYTIGQWEFGDEEYEYDFPVVKAYTIKANNLIEFLEQVKSTYLVGYRINTLDKTIDFGPSSGDRLSGFNIDKHVEALR